MERGTTSATRAPETTVAIAAPRPSRPGGGLAVMPMAPRDVSCLCCGGTPSLASRLRGAGEARVEVPVWACRCGAEVGCHAGTSVPLGRPGDLETRGLRRAAHVEMEALVSEAVGRLATARAGRRDPAREGRDRNELVAQVYVELSRRLDPRGGRVHFGSLDAAGCRAAIAAMAGLTARGLAGTLSGKRTRADDWRRHRPAAANGAAKGLRGEPERRNARSTTRAMLRASLAAE